MIASLDAMCGVIGSGESLVAGGEHCEIVVITIFAVDKEDWILEMLIHRGPLVNSLQESIFPVEYNVTGTICFNPISGNNDSSLVGGWEIVPSPVSVPVNGEL